MWSKFVAEFRAAPIPAEWKQKGPVPGIPDLTWEDIRFTYYSELDNASEPQKQQAKGAYKTCLSYSVKYQYFDEYSRTCEVWLSKNYPAEFHLIDEFRGSPSRVNSGLSERGAPLNLDGTPYRERALVPEGDEKKGTEKKEAAPGAGKESSAIDRATTKPKK
jgi:hypothetical protein